MRDNRVIRFNSHKGKWEYLETEERRLNSEPSKEGVRKIESHLKAAASVQNQKDAMIRAERERLDNIKEKELKRQRELQIVREEQEAHELKARKISEEKAKQEASDSLALAMKANRERYKLHRKRG